MNNIFNNANKQGNNFFNNNNNSNAPNTNAFNNSNNTPANNIFSGTNNTNSQPANNPTGNTNNLFNNNNNANQPPANMFGGGNTQNNPTAQVFGGKPIIPTPSFGNAQNSTQPNQAPTTNIFNNGNAGNTGNTGNTGGLNMFGNNKPATTNPPAATNTAGTTGGLNLGGNNNPQQPATSFFNQGQGQAGTTPSTTGNTAPGATGGVNIFANNNNAANTATNPPAAGTPNSFGKPNTNTSAPTGNFFGQNNQNPATNPTNPPVATNTPTNTQGTGGATTPNIFNNSNNAATTNTTPNQPGVNVFAQKPQTTPAQTNQPNPTATNAPTANLFNNQAQQGNTTAPQNNIFANNPNTNVQSNQANTSANPTQTNPVGAPANQGLIPVPNRDDLQSEFQKSNQTIGQLILEFKTTFTNSYEDLKRLAESTLKFLDQREENQRIADNFAEVEKMIGNNNETVMRTLDALEKQQDDIAHQIEVMSRKIGEGQYTHELSEHLQEYGQLRKLVMELQEGEGEWNDPGQEQLINIFENLNQVEVQIKEMNELVDIYLREN